MLLIADIHSLENPSDLPKITGNTATDCAEVTWDETPSQTKNIPFQKKSGLLVDMSANATPYEYFRLLVDDRFLDSIVIETNKYATQVFLSSGMAQHSRITRWKDITKEELLRFIGLLFHTGTIKCNVLKDYWKKHWLFGIPGFARYMSRDRFFLIMRCLHFAENPSEEETTPADRLFKIRPLLNYFQEKMSSVYYPNKNLSLDESMLLWRGKLVFRQYIQNKRHKYGIKSYMLTESEGLVMNLIVYAGKSDQLGGLGHAEKIVMSLMQNYLNVGHSLYMDNYYNSYGLAKRLLEKNTYCTGTLRANRKDSPKSIVMKKLQKGETQAAYQGGIMIGKWKDKREVSYISSEFPNDLVETQNKRGLTKEKPLPIAEYNKFMSGIDRMDQMISYYPVVRKTLRWYKKLGIHVLQLLLYNSYLLYNKQSTKRLSYYDFRMAVIEEILPEETRPKPSNQKSTQRVSEHTLEKIEIRGKDNRILRKRCRSCWKNGIRKDSPYHCTKCPDAPGLCVGTCFTEYHSNN